MSYKFKAGEVVKHKASGDKVVIIARKMTYPNYSPSATESYVYSAKPHSIGFLIKDEFENVYIAIKKKKA